MQDNLLSNEFFMRAALREATVAYEENEVPIGAVIVSNGKIIASEHNRTEQLCDVTAHAEILAITAAQMHLGAKFLTDCTLYITIEPCVMCAGAIKWGRLGRVVFGAPEAKFGFRTVSDKILHPKTELTTGVLEEECAALMKSFFAKRR